MKLRRWTKEEIVYLQTKWGTVSIQHMSKKLNRSMRAIKLKAQRLGLGDPSLHYDGITLHQLSLALNISYNILRKWEKSYGFPVKQKVFVNKMRVRVVTYDDFWKWAEENKQMIDFSKVEPNILGIEPEWVKEKRKADQIKASKIKKSHNDPWTEEEDNILKGMLNAFCYTYPEIAHRLNRSEGAIKHRIFDLGLKARPTRLNNHIKYTDEEIQLIVSLIEKGYCIEDIASRIGKSALGVRGKLERMGYKFKNGVPVRKKIV